MNILVAYDGTKEAKEAASAGHPACQGLQRTHHPGVFHGRRA